MAKRVDGSDRTFYFVLIILNVFVFLIGLTLVSSELFWGLTLIFGAVANLLYVVYSRLKLGW